MVILQNSQVSGAPQAPINHSTISVADLVTETLADAKAEHIFNIDLTDKSSIADYMIICSGRSSRHVSAIADHLITAISKHGFGKPRVEGLAQGDWVLIDQGDVIIHIFRPEVRSFYNLEKIWGDNRPQEREATPN